MFILFVLLCFSSAYFSLSQILHILSVVEQFSTSRLSSGPLWDPVFPPCFWNSPQLGFPQPHSPRRKVPSELRATTPVAFLSLHSALQLSHSSLGPFSSLISFSLRHFHCLASRIPHSPGFSSISRALRFLPP